MTSRCSSGKAAVRGPVTVAPRTAADGHFAMQPACRNTRSAAQTRQSASRSSHRSRCPHAGISRPTGVTSTRQATALSAAPPRGRRGRAFRPELHHSIARTAPSTTAIGNAICRADNAPFTLLSTPPVLRSAPSSPQHICEIQRLDVPACGVTHQISVRPRPKKSPLDRVDFRRTRAPFIHRRVQADGTAAFASAARRAPGFGPG